MSRLIEWFLDHHLKLMLAIGLVCTALMFAIGPNGLFTLAQTFVWLVLAGIGSWLFETETTENWLALSWSRMIKNVVGLLLIGFSWFCFLGGGRGGGGVLVSTIASLLSGSN